MRTPCLPAAACLTLLFLLPLSSAHSESLKTALAALGEVPATLVVDKDLVCDAPAIPANVEVVVKRGGRLLLGDTPLQVLGTLSAGRYQIFSPTGAVSGLKDPCPEWFGAGGQGATDDTVAVQRAIDSIGDRAGSRLILAGKYAVTSVVMRHFGSTIHAENAWLIARPGKSDYLLRFAPSAHSSTITGNLFIDGNYNLGYACAINVNARHFTAHNVNIWRAPLGWLIGDPAWATSGKPGDAEKGDSEIEIIGGSTCHCLRAVEAVGANTIVKFTGAFLYSFPWTLATGDPRKEAWEAADSTTLRAIGGAIYIDSGGIANFCSKPLINVQPIQTTAKEYFSDYGKVFVNSAHIESGNFFAATNPRRIVSRGRTNSLAIVGCNGYLSSDNPVVTTDPLFLGGVLIQNCGFYRQGRKSPIAVIGNAQATINIDTSCFFDASPKGLNAVKGGTQKFRERMIIHVQGADHGVPPDGAVVRFRKVQPLPDGANFEHCYDPQAGVFTCPYGGLVNVTVTTALAVQDGKPAQTGQLHLLKNGESVFCRRITAYQPEMQYTVPVLAEGDTLAIKLLPDAPWTLEDSVGSYLQITASRY